jgi:hypothetical protein
MLAITMVYYKLLPQALFAEGTDSGDGGRTDRAPLDDE